MARVEILVLLLLAVVLLAWLAERIRIAYPVVMLLGGGALSLVPRLPPVELDPDTVLLLFLPPLLYWQTINAPTRAFRALAVSISMLAVGLVLATATVVAAVAHLLVPDLSWPAAFVLGAIVAPTDPVAAEAVASRERIPERVMAVVQGESLVNDASALVAYKVALGALAMGFAWAPAVGQFFVVVVGGIACGLAVAAVLCVIWKRVPKGDAEMMLSLLAPYAAYLPAQALNVSGVLSVVAAGFYISRRAPRFLSAETRLRAYGFWDTVVFALNGCTFVLVGLQFRQVIQRIDASSGELLFLAAAVSFTVIATRMIWMFLGARLAWALHRRSRRHTPHPNWRSIMVAGWIGMRGAVSLAAALALPASADGRPFPHRGVLVFLTFGVIAATLIGQGATLPSLLRRLALEPDGSAIRERLLAQRRVVEAALEVLREQAEGVPEESRRALLARHEAHEHVLTHRERNEADDAVRATHDLHRRVSEAEREALYALARRGEIDNTTLRQELLRIDSEELAVPPLTEKVPPADG